jgi:histone demethylase JARID1
MESSSSSLDRSCAVCKCFLWSSYVKCECHSRVSCLEHVDLVCDSLNTCKSLHYRFSLREIEEIESTLVRISETCPRILFS